MHQRSSWEINSKRPWFKLGLRELLHYQDLIFSFVKRDLFASHKQSLLGPLWIVLQPLMTTLVYVIIFSNIGKLSTDGIPALLFYLPGIILWTYFADCVTGTMNTFIHQAHIFSKIYFPRLTVPISQVVTNTFRLVIQFGVFILIYLWYKMQGAAIEFHPAIFLLPFLVLITAAFAMSAGLLISVLTARYRDLENIVQFILRLLMFATPVIYPSSIVPKQYQLLFWTNPLTSIIETTRIALFSHGEIPWTPLLITSAGIILLTYISVAIFKQFEILIADII